MILSLTRWLPILQSIPQARLIWLLTRLGRACGALYWSAALRFAVKGNPTTIPTPHPKLRVAKARSADQSWVSKLVGSMKEHDTKDDAHVRRDLKKSISEYSHSSKPYLKTVSEKRAL